MACGFIGNVMEGEKGMRRIRAVLLLAIFFIAITAASVWLFWSHSYVEPTIGGDDEVLPADGKLHILIIGEDDGLVAPGKSVTGRSDTLMVASYDPKSGDVSLLSVPRDTLVEIPGRKNKDKINHALVFGGIDLTMRTVSNFLNMPLRYYVHVQTDGFRRIVDAIGGVPIHVEKDMRYRDKAGGLHINLKQGEQVLTGEQAEGYVRYRLDSDIKRIERQQKFIAAALKEALKPSNLFKINQLFKIVAESVKTNIPISVGWRYLSIVQSFRNSNVTSFTIEGDDSVVIDGINYFVPDMVKLEELVENYFYSAVDKSTNKQITVQVLIGNEDRASGEQVAQMLRKNGFSVLGIDMADRSDYLISEVSGRSKDAALAVAEALALHEVLIESQPEAGADVVVIVGKDLSP